MPIAIPIAANSSPIGMGLGQDSVALRAIVRFSDAALFALAALFAAFERLGKWCEVFNLVLIVLLPKGVAASVFSDGRSSVDAGQDWVCPG